MTQHDTPPTTPTPLSDFDAQAHIGQLWVHPVKSCAAVRVPAARLLPTGLEGDREWMVVDAEGEFVSQRELARMALVRPRLDASHLHLDAPGLPTLTLPRQAPRTAWPLTVRVWDDTVPALDLGEAAASWLAQCLGQHPDTPTGLRQLRLVQFDATRAARQPRLSSAKWTGGQAVPNRFGDGFPVLVASQASLDGLNARLHAQGLPPVDMRRFRPNLVLAGVDAHDEDRLEGLALDAEAGDGPHRVVLALTKPCARCPIPDVNPDTAERGTAVGDALAAYRRDPRLGGAITFGMNGFAQTPLPAEGVWLREGQALAGNWRFD